MGGEIRKMRGPGVSERALGPEVEMRFADRLAELMGRIVVVSGTFPLPIPPSKAGEAMQIVCAPTSKGKLVAVYADAFDLLDENGGDTEPETYLFANVRCVQPISALLVPKPGIVKPGVKLGKN